MPEISGLLQSPVGASLLAKVVNDDAPGLDECGGLRFFASKLAPTGSVLCQALRKQLLNWLISLAVALQQDNLPIERQLAQGDDSYLGPVFKP